ncbi:hypothetical protein [Arthrobacter sp. 9AX]|uniref:hypothetical protein n=1 Tax=Arthrobacter sp. 9AX TaxID=2653131 RepID=UPI00135A144C
MEKMGIRCTVLFLSLGAVFLSGTKTGRRGRLGQERNRSGKPAGSPSRRAGYLDNPERGDVPGWVMITLMSAVLVAALLALAGPALEAMFNQAMDKVGS